VGALEFGVRSFARNCDMNGSHLKLKLKLKKGTDFYEV
jgi:hypothetical protein